MDFTARFGRFLTGGTASEALGLSPESLDELVAASSLLRVETEDGLQIYPELQFDGHSGSTVSGLPEILQILLPAAADGWTVLYWLTSPLLGYGGRTPVELLREGTASEAETILTMAKQDAAVWWL